MSLESTIADLVVAMNSATAVAKLQMDVLLKMQQNAQPMFSQGTTGPEADALVAAVGKKGWQTHVYRQGRPSVSERRVHAVHAREV